jgi:hypothetical protein
MFTTTTTTRIKTHEIVFFYFNFFYFVSSFKAPTYEYVQVRVCSSSWYSEWNFTRRRRSSYSPLAFLALENNEQLKSYEFRFIFFHFISAWSTRYWKYTEDSLLALLLRSYSIGSNGVCLRARCYFLHNLAYCIRSKQYQYSFLNIPNTI